MGGLGGGSKPKKQAAPVKAAAPVTRENEAVQSAKQDEIRRAYAGQGRKSANLLQSSKAGSEKKSLLG